jgi:hypothetical protein
MWEKRKKSALDFLGFTFFAIMVEVHGTSSPLESISNKEVVVNFTFKLTVKTILPKVSHGCVI